MNLNHQPGKELPFSMRKTSHFYMRAAHKNPIPPSSWSQQNVYMSKPQHPLSYNNYDLNDATLKAFEEQTELRLKPKVRPSFDPE